MFITGMPYAVAKPLVADFEKKYPGVHLDVIDLVGLEFNQRFELETKNNQHRIDVMTINDYPAMKSLIDKAASRNGGCRPRTGSRKARSVISPTRSTTRMLRSKYNETRVTDDEAKILERWEWATNPRFKGRFGVAIQRCSTCYAPLQMMLDPRVEKTFGWPFLEKMADNKPGIYRNTDFLADRVVAGEKDIAFTEAEGTRSACAIAERRCGGRFRARHLRFRMHGSASRRRRRIPTPRGCS